MAGEWPVERTAYPHPTLDPGLVRLAVAGLNLGANVAIILLGLLTWWTASGWPDIVLGLVIIGLNLHAAKEVWEVATEESLAARALAGEDIED